MIDFIDEKEYLSQQIITYLGNKRGLIDMIEESVKDISREIGATKIRTLDLFSGSGVVARMLKKYSSCLIVNDLEFYSKVINECYLTNYSDFNESTYIKYKQILDETLKNLNAGIITNNYAPKDDNNIQKGERVFYTHENALIIDTIRNCIEDFPQDIRKYFLAPLLYEASVHTNTSGVFKGFFKDSSTGKGKFGGNAENALSRIKSKISIKKPVLSPYNCEVQIFQKKAEALAQEVDVDLTYIDPPYNQHPYGSNYFMLNTIARNQLGKQCSTVSGIPTDWTRSNFNKKSSALNVFESIVKNINSKYLLISYNSEGFISVDEIMDMLLKYGTLNVKKYKYNTYRGSRNLKERNIYVNEYIFILKKDSQAKQTAFDDLD